MKLPEFLIANNRVELNSPVILCTKSPYIIAQVWTFKDLQAWTSFINNYSGLAKFQIPDYKIALTFLTTISGRLDIYPGIDKEVLKTLSEMADFYVTERINDKPGYYKKFML